MVSMYKPSLPIHEKADTYPIISLLIFPSPNIAWVFLNQIHSMFHIIDPAIKLNLCKEESRAYPIMASDKEVIGAVGSVPKGVNCSNRIHIALQMQFQISVTM